MIIQIDTRELEKILSSATDKLKEQGIRMSGAVYNNFYIEDAEQLYSLFAWSIDETIKKYKVELEVTSTQTKFETLIAFDFEDACEKVEDLISDGYIIDDSDYETIIDRM